MINTFTIFKPNGCDVRSAQFNTSSFPVCVFIQRQKCEVLWIGRASRLLKFGKSLNSAVYPKATPKEEQVTIGHEPIKNSAQCNVICVGLFILLTVYDAVAVLISRAMQFE